MKSKKNNLNIKKILIIFLILQPFIDVVTYFTSSNFSISFGIIMRSVFLVFLVLYSIKEFKLKDSYKMYIYFVFVAIYLGLYLLFFSNKTYFLNNIIYTFKSFYYPVSLVLIYNIFKLKKIKIDYKVFSIIFMIYICVILFADITNTSNLSYNHSKVGNIGWFMSANEISAILSFLMPFMFLNLIEIKNIMLKSFLVIVIVSIIITIGTKGPIISLLIILTIMFIRIISKTIKSKKYKELSIIIISIIVMLIIFLNVFKITPFYKNLVIHYSFLEMDSPFEIFQDYKKFDHFIFSERLTFLSYADKAYDRSDAITKLIGLGYYIESSPGKFKEKLIEMDTFEIFYRHGIIGFIIYFIPSLYLFVVLFKNNVKKLNSETIAFLESIFIISLFSLIIGHTLTSPGVSVFVSIILINFIYMGRENLNDKN